MLFRRTNVALRRASALSILLATTASGCGDDTSATSGNVGASGGASGAASSGSGAGALAAPTLLEVAPFALALRITWEAPKACGTIEGERRTAVLDYAPVFEAPGTDTIYVDEAATSDQTYTYRLRCKQGDALSAYSNEKTGNPMKF